MSPHRIRNLEIAEISSVRKESARGAKVLLLKSANERNQTMSETMGVVSIAKRAPAALVDGTLTQETYAKLQQRLAQEQFPNDSIGVALSKFYATPHGAEMLNAGLRTNYESVQKRTALGAYELVAKAHGNPASRQSEYETPDTEEADETPHTGGIDTDEPFDQQVERLMKEKNISRDAAITLIYRAEKVAKGLSW